MSGSISSLKLKGLPFDVAGDSDFSESFTKFINTIVVTSGRNSISQEKRVQEVSGVVLILRKGDKKLLRDLQDSGEEFSISYRHADGEGVKCVGTINIDNNTTKENRCSLSLLPVTEWTELE